MEDVKMTATGKKLTCGISSSLDEIIARKGITKTVSSSEINFLNPGTTTVVLEHSKNKTALSNEEIIKQQAIIKQETIKELQTIVKVEAPVLELILYGFMRNLNNFNLEFYIRCFEKKANNKNVLFSEHVEEGYRQGIFYLKNVIKSWQNSGKAVDEFFSEKTIQKVKQLKQK